MSRNRALAPVLGVVLLLAAAAVLSATVATSLSTVDAPDGPPRASLSLRVDPATNAVAITHEGGESLPVSRLRVRVSVDGDPLRHQPPVPFFSATGFAPGPTGPFNSASDDEWTAGETGTFRIAGTNDPEIRPDAVVAVELFVDDALVAELTAVASGPGAVGDQSAADGDSSVSSIADSASGSPVSSGTRATVVMAMSGS